ncbi:1-phosphofructokinase family hexose kinase [Phytoactinopolyspora halotolerans]|uniref:1-phosphofructokinase family hexose kinase n=1 Tax=Phytoactinopolyspora halotolerans TaxID=1981512 RepID=UPI001C2016E2|nr:hexose kinase [Phytoactinopolyspora halotolerans]
MTPNPALDITYLVDRLRPGHVHRVRAVRSRPGGKGVNVARVVRARGVPAVVTGILGGATGETLRAGLTDLGIEDAMLTEALETRRTVNIVDDAGTATLLNEGGPDTGDEPWARLSARVAELALGADVAVVSGSLPPGPPPEAVAGLMAAAGHGGTPVIVDTSGPALRHAAEAGPAVLKPNVEELREVTGIDDPHRAAVALRRLGTGATAVVASLGADGLLGVTADGSWTARLAEPVIGNPTGAGDSVVAALALAVRAGDGCPDALRDACALSAATVLSPVAGEYDADAYTRLRTRVIVSEVQA